MSDRPVPTRAVVQGGRIIVVGLGPGDPDQLTKRALQWLDSGHPVWLRTRIHPTVEALPNAHRWHDFDALYEQASNFDTLYQQIVSNLLAEAQVHGGPIVYAVPGHPTMGERTVAALRQLAPQHGIAVEIIPGISFLDVIAPLLPVDPLTDNLQVVDGLDLAGWLDREPFGGGTLPIAPLRPALIGQVYNPAVASAVKLALGRLYPDTHPVMLLRACGVAGAEETHTIPLHQLDHSDSGIKDHLTSLFVPALAPEHALRTAVGLQAITARLRAPDGCPWDREQTHQSIRANFIEETYEAIDALDSGDMDAFRDEMGDVLLQVYLQAQMAEEAGEFVLEEVYEAIAAKLVRRHPHVFADVVAADSDAVLRNWDRIKEAERQAKGTTAKKTAPSALDGIPRSLPALDRVALAQDRINRLAPAALQRASGGFVADLDRALAALHADNTDSTRRQLLIGEALFALVGLAQGAGINAEQALGAALHTVATRFKALEGDLRATKRDWLTLTREEVQAIWAGPTTNPMPHTEEEE